MTTDMLYDLYLFVYSSGIKETIKLSQLTMADATKYAHYWREMNEMHDYMLVISVGNPWLETSPVIKEKTVDWLLSEYAKLSKA